MPDVLDVLPVAALAVVALMVTTWLLSLVLRDASVVDVVWGLGFVVVAWASWLAGDSGSEPRQVLLVVLTSVWGLRLGGYLAWRNLGQGEDFRYVKMRRYWGSRFWLISLGTVFALQGVLMWIVSLPIQVGQVADPADDLGPVGWAGAGLWLVGFLFESVGDAQLARFKASPDAAGKIMDRGLWAWTRHPNYFGDFCVWWGLWLVTASTGSAWWTVVGPIVMSVLLLRVSGKDLLERNLRKRRPGYEDYIARTSGFFPRPPRRHVAGPDTDR